MALEGVATEKKPKTLKAKDADDVCRMYRYIHPRCRNTASDAVNPHSVSSH